MSLSLGSKLPSSLHFETLQVLFGITFKASSFPVKALFCLQVLIWYFGLTLRTQDVSTGTLLAFSLIALGRRAVPLKTSSCSLGTRLSP